MTNPIRISRRISRGRLGFLLAACALAACKSAPPPEPKPVPVTVKLSIAVSPDVNPDSQKRPSPIVVRVYQLKDDAAFKAADFFALYDKEQATLAASLVSRERIRTQAGRTRDAGILALIRYAIHRRRRGVSRYSQRGLAGLERRSRQGLYRSGQERYACPGPRYRSITRHSGRVPIKA